ncbi:MAG: hypothetical protein DI622_01950 [Chryseobacterium sp.]|nr:MAG: hypothetical protein DI622_01950 [Chryseobacterium sp.]
MKLLVLAREAKLPAPELFILKINKRNAVILTKEKSQIFSVNTSDLQTETKDLHFVVLHSE